MRPAQLDLLATLRTSLNDTLLPTIEDRWARYVANAMDLVLQHLELRLAGEADALAEDSADMAGTLAELVDAAARAARAEAAPDASQWTELADLVPAVTERGPSLAEATTGNERLRDAVVAVIHWLDAHEDDLDPTAVADVRDAVHRLVRRQLDRMTAFVKPLYMSFGPVAS